MPAKPALQCEKSQKLNVSMGSSTWGLKGARQLSGDPESGELWNGAGKDGDGPGHQTDRVRSRASAGGM